MKKLATLLVSIAALIMFGHAHAETLDDANRAFAGGHYHDSTLGYQAVLAENGYSAPVLFDLGNSYFREGDLAQAILAYQRAKWLAPNDPDIAANLALAQKQVGLPVAEPRWSDKVARLLNASGWAWLGCAAWTLLCLSLLVRSILPQRQALFTFSALVGALVLLTAGVAMLVSSGPLHQAVVIDKNASALISPFPDAQSAFTPSPGETVTVEKAYDDFLLVKDAAGKSGWISKKQIMPIVPS